MKKVLSVFVLISIGLVLNGCGLFESQDGPYKVTFNSNGGTLVEPMNVEAFQPFLPNEVPIKDGYTFGGWYLDSNFYYPMSFNAGTNEKLTLYAKWIEATTSLTEAQIRGIIDSILLDEDLMIADEETIISIVNQLILSNELIDEQAVIAAVLSNINVVELFEAHVTSMIDDVRQSVVMIDTYSGSQVDGGGSGIIYKKVGSTYYVLTNEHVVAGYTSSQLAVTIFNKTGDVKINKGSVTIKGVSIAHDMAVITFTSAQNLRVIEFGTKESLKVAQMVFAIGSPLDLPNSVTMGVISHINRPMEDDEGMDTITIQHTATINPGNSGGALVNIYGKLVGLNNMSYVDEYVGEGIEGLHFAIQIDIITQMLPQLE
ncbi:MAG: trypsin-like peptidase domain-containing protein [Acholeplasmataceae bacterium]|nr:trypsin-like peptidase domain-containing protein [Acholeplasmataceae bacterium]